MHKLLEHCNRIQVLNLLYNLAHSPDCPVEIMDQALAAHIKILDSACFTDRAQHKIHWLERLCAELRSIQQEIAPKQTSNDETNAVQTEAGTAAHYWVLPALRLIREICNLYHEVFSTRFHFFPSPLIHSSDF